jgi:hypothetical protein
MATTTANRTAVKTAATKRSSSKKSSTKKATATTATGRTAHAKKGATRKYSPSAGADVEREMRAMKEGKLTSGRSGKKVTNPKQAIAIGLSEARKEGKKVPPSPKRAA